MAECPPADVDSSFRAEFAAHRVIYIEGAGSDKKPWEFLGVEAGLRDAGVQGEIVDFLWNTGDGVRADQTASEQYKRARAAELASLITDSVRSDADTPIDIIAFSAGCVIAVYALEALPATSVRSVVLLNAANRADYDFGPALDKTTGSWSVLVTPNDLVLASAVALFGVAEGEYCGPCALGLRGVELPAGVELADRPAYARICNLAWRTEFRALGHMGGHDDSLRRAFIRAQVAPRLHSGQ